MATHPSTPLGISLKSALINRVNALLFSKSTAIPGAALEDEGIQCRVMRIVALCAASYAASVVENALGQGRGVVLGFEEKEEALTRCDDLLTAFSTFPFSTAESSTTTRRRQKQPRKRDVTQEAIAELTKEATRELQMEGGDTWELYGEVVGAVFEIWGRMDSIL
jgi:Golgi phosphoprotein 3